MPNTIRGQGKERVCPYCGTTSRLLPSHIRRCSDVPTTEEVVDA